MDRAAKLIGMPLTQAQCAGVFSRLGLSFIEQPNRLVVTPPSWRFDLRIEEDLVEEVIRVIGYDQLPLTPPKAPITARVRAEARRSAFEVRHALAALDYQETINFSFVEARWEHELAGNADPIQVLNPIAAPLAVMRSSLIGSLVQVLRHNLARKADRVRVFEIGRVALRDATVLASDTTVAGVHQPMRVAGLAHGPVDGTQWGSKERPVDFFDVKGDIESLLSPRHVEFEPATHPALHPGRSASVLVGGLRIGHVGELHPRWRQSHELPNSAGATILFELDLEAVLQRPMPHVRPIARHQPAWRDLALTVPELISHATLKAALSDDPSGLVRSATLFDVYKPAAQVGQRSMAVRVELLDSMLTLTDERIDLAVAEALERAAQRAGARLRT